MLVLMKIVSQWMVVANGTMLNVIKGEVMFVKDLFLKVTFLIFPCDH